MISLDNLLIVLDTNQRYKDVLSIEYEEYARADTVRDLSYPTDCTYTQYPNFDTNIFIDKETSSVLFGGDWELRETKLFNNQKQVSYL